MYLNTLIPNELSRIVEKLVNFLVHVGGVKGCELYTQIYCYTSLWLLNVSQLCGTEKYTTSMTTGPLEIPFDPKN